VMHGQFDPPLPLTIAKFDSTNWTFYRNVEAHPLIATAVRGRPVVIYVSRNRSNARKGGDLNTTVGSGEWRDLCPAEAV